MALASEISCPMERRRQLSRALAARIVQSCQRIFLMVSPHPVFSFVSHESRLVAKALTAGETWICTRRVKHWNTVSRVGVEMGVYVGCSVYNRYSSSQQHAWGSKHVSLNLDSQQAGSMEGLEGYFIRTSKTATAEADRDHVFSSPARTRRI